MRVAIGADAVEGPGRIAHQPRIEAEIAGHPRRGLHAMIGRGAADDKALDILRAQPLLQVRADEGAIHFLDDHRLACTLARFILDLVATFVRQDEFGRVP